MKLVSVLRRSLVALALAAPLALVPGTMEGTAYAQQAGQRIGVVDVQRAVMQTEDGLRAQATLKKLFDNKQQELNRRQADLQKQKDEIDKQAKVLSKEAYSKRLEDLNKQLMELQSVFVDYNKELDKKQKELTEPIFEKIMGIVKRIATTENFDIVVDRATVAYVRTDLDLTDKVIQMYNSGGAPAPAGSGAPPAASGSAAPH